MTDLLEVIFWLSILLFLHSYFFYPISLMLIHFFIRRKSIASNDSYFPMVSSITSVYNEASVIQKKIETLLSSNYPKDKLTIYIGSDASSDESNEVIAELTKHNAQIKFFPYSERRGKSSVINDLMKEAFLSNPKAPNHIILFTDANVMLQENTIFNLCQHYIDPSISLVDSCIVPIGIKDDGISRSEKAYMNYEIFIKHKESSIWGNMMGAFGGCFTIRSTEVVDVPPNFIVDDFFLSMIVLEKNKKSINDLKAICTEGIPNILPEEFKRKVRISSGNYQNLMRFRKFLYSPPFSRWYCFLSHKVLRWIGPFILIAALGSCLLLSLSHKSEYQVISWILCFIVIGIPSIDLILQKLNLHVKSIRNVRYFISMNIALLKGFFIYLKGIRKSSWEPPKRSL